MRLLRLRLENFRQHRDSEIEFADGMTAIVGANGSGKTTVLEAITYVLYGEQRDRTDSIRFYWAEGRKFCVTLRFELEGRTFEVRRSNTDAYLSDVTDGLEVVRAAGRTYAKRACEKLLGLNYDQFINSFCAEQKNLAFLNFRTSAEQQDEIARMLGFDRLKLAESRAKETRGRFRAAAEVLERNLGNLDQIRAELQEAQAELAKSEKLLRDTEARLATLVEQLPQAETKRDQATLYLELSHELAGIRGRAEGLKENLAQAEKAEAAAKRDAEEKKALAGAEAEFAKIEAQIRECEAQREADRNREKLAVEAAALDREAKILSQKIASLMAPDLGPIEKDIQELIALHAQAQQACQKAQDSWQSQRHAIGKELAAAKQRVAHECEGLSRSEALLEKGICAECEQPLKAEYAKSLDRRRDSLREAKAEAQSLELRAAKLEERPQAVIEAEKQREELSEKHHERQKDWEAASALRARVQDLQHDLDDKRKLRIEVEALLAEAPILYDRERHELLKARLAELEPKHRRWLSLCETDERLRKAREVLRQAKASLETEKERYRELEGARAKLPVKDAEEAGQIIADCQTLTAAIGVEQERRAGSERLIVNQKRLAEQAAAKIADHEKRAADLKEARVQDALHSQAAVELRALREELNRTIRPELEARASETLSLLTNGRYPVLHLDDSFRPTVLDDGIGKAVISGGEEDVVALSLRLALSELIQERQGRPMGLLVLDEVFGSLDAERRQAVLDRLLALKGRFSQILVISHIEEINQIADRCIYLRRNEQTRATVVGSGLVEEPLPPELCSAEPELKAELREVAATASNRGFCT